MIPILYPANETAFISEGIGPLSDVLSCYVEEEKNGSYELEMEYPVTGILFSEIKTGRVILAKASDSGDWQPFDIYNVSPTMDGVVTVNAEHISYRLSGIPVEPFNATGIVSALQGLKQHSLISNPFTVWTDIDNTTTKFSVKIPQSFRSCLAGTDGSILDTFSGSRGCEYEFDRFQVKVHAHRGQNNGVFIEYGKNLTDLEQEEDISECFTGVLAYWKDSQNAEQMLWSDIQYIENHASYPRERIYVLDASNDFDQDETVTKELLNQRAAKYGEDNDIGRPSVNLTISFINLSQTVEFADSAPIESVRLCDEVNVYFPLLEVDVTTQVIRTKYDSILERYEEIELGDVKNSFADTIKQSVNDSVVKPAVDETKSIFTEALKYATDKLTGAYGGHVVIGRNADGEPNEIYIMDTDSVETAQTVLRINMNGIGGSTTGINGPYKLAILTDGTINASQILSGTIDGNLIRGGTIMAGALDEVLKANINDAYDNSVSAIDKSQQAQNAANNAQATANGAQSTANGAQSTANNALDTANGAYQQALEVQAQAEQAQNDANEANRLAQGALDGLSELSNAFWADSTGAHVRDTSGSETVIQGDGMHNLVGGDEVARFTKDDSHVDNLAVSRFLMFGAHRAEMVTINGEQCTGFFWIGDVQ